MTQTSCRPIWVNGEWVRLLNPTPRSVVNPSTLKEIAVVADCGAEEVGAAVRAARAAQRAWWKTPALEKAGLLKQIAKSIRARERELAYLMTEEGGKPISESFDCVDWVAACFDYYAEVGRSTLGQSLPPVAPHQLNFTVKEPLGVVAAIVPFNFPLLLMAWKVAPALAAGNTLVCKAPHQNPLSNLLLAECYACLPPGVVNVITGGAQTGEALVSHPDVDCIAFTGSTEVGRKIAASAGQNLKKVNLELGGIDPFIVFEDADLDVAVPGVAWTRLLNAGQVCTSAKRIYVPKMIAASFKEKLLAHVSTIRLGDPAEPETDLGPLISEDALQRVESQVRSAVEQGATLVCGGKRVAPRGLKGYFYAPTILSEVQHGSLPTTEEVFGPVLSIIETKDGQEAIRLANDSKYGLGASIYTNNLETAMFAMENIKAGTFWINDPLTDNDAGPFGGMRWSGMGRELGEEGLNAFRETKHVHLDYRMETKPYWYPYKNRKVHAKDSQ